MTDFCYKARNFLYIHWVKGRDMGYNIFRQRPVLRTEESAIPTSADQDLRLRKSNPCFPQVTLRFTGG
jgi:hypothetical protein